MHSTKVLLSIAALAGASLAEEFPAPDCQERAEVLIANAPPVPPSLEPYFSGGGEDSAMPGDLLVHPDVYVAQICSLATELPKDVLADFRSYGPALLEYASVSIAQYDAVVTGCITTGAAAASITSYIHSIASHPGALCQPTSTPGSGSNSTASITPYPTASGNGTLPTATPSPTSTIPTAAAARPTNVLAGAAAMGGLLGVVALL